MQESTLPEKAITIDWKDIIKAYTFFSETNFTQAIKKPDHSSIEKYIEALEAEGEKQKDTRSKEYQNALDITFFMFCQTPKINHIPLLKRLLNLGANINSYQFALLPLQAALLAQNNAVIEFLLAQMPDPSHYANQQGINIIEFAICNGNDDAVIQLLAAYADQALPATESDATKKNIQKDLEKFQLYQKAKHYTELLPHFELTEAGFKKQLDKIQNIEQLFFLYIQRTNKRSTIYTPTTTQHVSKNFKKALYERLKEEIKNPEMHRKIISAVGNLEGEEKEQSFIAFAKLLFKLAIEEKNHVFLKAVLEKLNWKANWQKIFPESAPAENPFALIVGKKDNEAIDLFTHHIQTSSNYAAHFIEILLFNLIAKTPTAERKNENFRIHLERLCKASGQVFESNLWKIYQTSILHILARHGDIDTLRFLYQKGFLGQLYTNLIKQVRVPFSSASVLLTEYMTKCIAQNKPSLFAAEMMMLLHNAAPDLSSIKVDSELLKTFQHYEKLLAMLEQNLSDKENANTQTIADIQKTLTETLLLLQDPQAQQDFLLDILNIANQNNLPNAKKNLVSLIVDMISKTENKLSSDFIKNILMSLMLLNEQKAINEILEFLSSDKNKNEGFSIEEIITLLNTAGLSNNEWVISTILEDYSHYEKEICEKIKKTAGRSGDKKNNFLLEAIGNRFYIQKNYTEALIFLILAGGENKRLRHECYKSILSETGIDANTDETQLFLKNREKKNIFICTLEKKYGEAHTAQFRMELIGLAQKDAEIKAYFERPYFEGSLAFILYGTLEEINNLEIIINKKYYISLEKILDKKPFLLNNPAILKMLAEKKFWQDQKDVNSKATIEIILKYLLQNHYFDSILMLRDSGLDLSCFQALLPFAIQNDDLESAKFLLTYGKFATSDADKQSASAQIKTCILYHEELNQLLKDVENSISQSSSSTDSWGKSLKSSLGFFSSAANAANNLTLAIINQYKPCLEKIIDLHKNCALDLTSAEVFVLTVNNIPKEELTDLEKNHKALHDMLIKVKNLLAKMCDNKEFAEIKRNNAENNSEMAASRSSPKPGT